MFPYYWNGFNTGVPYAASISGLMRRDIGLGALPEEVQEALEQHEHEFRSEEDMKRFIDELNLRK